MNFIKNLRVSIGNKMEYIYGTCLKHTYRNIRW